jgi:hypothetical protein
MDIVWAYLNVPELTDTILGMVPPRFHHSGRVIRRLGILERASSRAIAHEAASPECCRLGWFVQLARKPEHNSSDVRSR